MLNYDQLVEGHPEDHHSFNTINAMTGASREEVNELEKRGVLVSKRVGKSKRKLYTAESVKAYVNRLERRKKPKDNELLNMIAVAALLQKPTRWVREKAAEKGLIHPSLKRSNGKKYVFMFRDLKTQPFFMDLYKKANNAGKPLEWPPLFTEEQPEPERDDRKSVQAALNEAFGLPAELPPDDSTKGPLLERRGKVLSVLTTELTDAVFKRWAEDTGYSKDFLCNNLWLRDPEFRARYEQMYAERRLNMEDA